MLRPRARNDTPSKEQCYEGHGDRRAATTAEREVVSVVGIDARSEAPAMRPGGEILAYER
jgi:hypothetical protein